LAVATEVTTHSAAAVVVTDGPTALPDAPVAVATASMGTAELTPR